MRKILPVVLALIGLAGGVGAGLVLKPPPEAEADPGTVESSDEAAPVQKDAASHQTHGDGDETSSHPADLEYVKLNNQFVIPVVDEGRVASLVVLSISLQVGTGTREAVFAREPKLRDAFLQVLFDHANAGGFDGVFTTSENLRSLRRALLEAAQRILGEAVSDALITDLVRQDS